MLALKLNRKKVKAAVESLLDGYRVYKYFWTNDHETNITTNLSHTPPSLTNRIVDQTGDMAARNADKEFKREDFISRVEDAVKRLPQLERELIEIRYMDRDSQYLTDYAVYAIKLDPPISAVTYGKRRESAFEKLYLMLHDLIVNIE